MRGRGGSAVRHPGGDVHRVPHAQEGRGLVPAGRAQALAHGQQLRQGGPQQPGVLRLRRLGAALGTLLISQYSLRPYYNIKQ